MRLVGVAIKSLSATKTKNSAVDFAVRFGLEKNS